jgi:hypothetical protein
VEQLAVAAGPDLVDGRRVQVDEDGARNIFALAGLGEEGLEGASIADILGVGVGASVRSQTVLEEVAVGGIGLARSRAVRR